MNTQAKILCALLTCFTINAQEERIPFYWNQKHFITYTCNAMANTMLCALCTWNMHDAYKNTDNETYGSTIIPITLSSACAYIGYKKYYYDIPPEYSKKSAVLSCINGPVDIALILGIGIGTLLDTDNPLLPAACTLLYLAKYTCCNRPSAQDNNQEEATPEKELIPPYGS